MSTNTLQTVVDGIVKALHVNEIVSALVGSFVGRNSSGAATSGQNLGTEAIPWGNTYITDMIYKGVPVAPDVFESSRNRIVSGAVRSTSGQPDFIRADGATNEFTILATTTPLSLIINDEVVPVSSDITVTGLSLAPSSNNTAAINDAAINDDVGEPAEHTTKFIGEDIGEIDLTTVGTQISSKVGLFEAFDTAQSELFFALIGTSSTLSDAYRGYFLDSAGAPIERDTIDDAETITILKLGWIFIQNNGITVDVSYITPIVSGTEPVLGLDGNSLIDGQYWFDLDAQEWLRYSSGAAAFQTLNRILIGLCVMDTSNCIATRSFDFAKEFSSRNTINLRRISDTVVKSRQVSNSVSVYGTVLTYTNGFTIFNTATDMESGVSLAILRRFYLYVTETGVSQISDKRPYRRTDLAGYYHPYNSWRCVGEFYYSALSTIEGVKSFRDLIDPSIVVKGTTGGAYYDDIASPSKEIRLTYKLGPWDMDADATRTISPKGLNEFMEVEDYRIRSVSAVIIPDQPLATSYDILHLNTGASAPAGGISTMIAQSPPSVGLASITIGRVAGGFFDSTTFNDATQNRGFVYITLEA